jgi:hypothetical protein
VLPKTKPKKTAKEAVPLPGGMDALMIFYP